MREPPHIVSSIVVCVIPGRQHAVAAAMAELPGVEIGPTHNNKIVALLEGRTRGEVGAHLAHITQIDGVIAANMVFEHAGEGQEIQS
jgi:nitrate reductase NapD